MANRGQEKYVSITEPIRVILEKERKTRINWGLVWSIFIPAIVSIFALYFSNSITAKRERKNRLRDEMILYAIETYNDLNLAQEKSFKHDSAAYSLLDKAFSRIQLFGTDQQINLIKQNLNEVVAHNTVELGPIVNSLRNQLRKELSLSEIDLSVVHFRLMPPE